jgi:Mrp family chromosome partitioning ATPase
LAARWPIVLVVALVGVLGGMGGAYYRNSQIQPLFKGTAPVSFVQAVADSEDTSGRSASGSGGGQQSSGSSQLDDAKAVADSVTEAFRASSPNSVVEIDAETGLLNFVAYGRTAEAAQQKATEFREIYLDTPVDSLAQQVDDQIAALETQLDTARAQIDSLTAAVALEDPYVDQRAELEAAMLSLQNQAAALRLELLIPEVFGQDDTAQSSSDDEERTDEVVQEELDKVMETITRIRGELEAIPAVEESEFTEEQTALRAAEAHYAELEADYQTLYLARQEFESPLSRELVTSTPETPESSSMAVFGGLGLLVGSLIGAGTVLGLDRLTRPVWVATDLGTLQTLATVRDRKPTSTVWYDNAGDDPRRRQVQSLRAAVAGRVKSRSGSLTVVGDQLKPDGVRTVAADLATAFAQSGRTVVLVDADFSSHDPMAELPDSKVTLAGLAVDLSAGVRPSLDAVAEVRPNLWSVPAGSFDEDPADLLAGDVFDRVNETLGRRFDIVVVSAGDVVGTVAQEVVHRTEGAVLVASAGKSGIESVRMVADEYASRGANLLGAVIVRRPALLGRIRSKLSRLIGRRRRVIPASVSERRSEVSQPAVVVAVPETHHEPVVPPAPRVVPERVSPGQHDEPETAPTGHRLIDLIRASASAGEGGAEGFFAKLAQAGPEKAYGPVSDFVVELCEEIILRPESVGFSHDGMLPLHPVKDRTTVGTAISAYLKQELGNQEGTALDRQIVELLFGSGPLKSVQVPRRSIDAWMSVAFFRIHAARTGREPEIWHIVSPNRFFQIMVDGRRFDAHHVSTLADVVLPMFIADVERQQKAAERFGSQEAIAQLDRAIVDARTLGIQLGWLLHGSDARSRLWFPWSENQPLGWEPRWEEGIKPHLAPLQRLGLLAAPVLTDQELDEFVSPGT